VCGRMNHYICDGDSGEDGGEEQRGHGRQRRGNGGSGGSVGDSFPAAGIMGEHRPLAPSFMASWEPSLMEMGSMGEAKTWL
jgi:hypothetical protein